jgi:hypothetical protein
MIATVGDFLIGDSSVDLAACVVGSSFLTPRRAGVM